MPWRDSGVLARTGGPYLADTYQPVTDRYRVSFAGNNLTPREKVEDFLLYRAAEVTLDSGNDYFVLVDQDTERFTNFRTTTTGFGGFSGLYGSPYRFGGVWYGPGFFRDRDLPAPGALYSLRQHHRASGRKAF